MLSALVVTWLSFGCSESQDKITLVAMDLIPCLGEIDTPEPRPNEMIPAAESTCRDTLNQNGLGEPSKRMFIAAALGF